MKKEIPQKLLVQIAAVVPLDAEVLPLNFQYEDEDYNIAVFVSKHTDDPTLQDRLYDLIFTYDDQHGTSTLCNVWPRSERPYIIAA